MRQSKYDRIIGALLSEPTREAAATKAGVSPATIFRYLAVPSFQRAYREARARLFESAVSQLQAASLEAVGTLRENLKSESDAVSTRPAVAILELADAFPPHVVCSWIGNSERITAGYYLLNYSSWPA